MKLTKREKVLIRVATIVMCFIVAAAIFVLLGIWFFLIADGLGLFWGIMFVLFVLIVLVYIANRE